jgi:hypothetical protein
VGVLVLASALALAELANATASLNTDRRSAVGARSGITHCVDETHAGSVLPFIAWLEAQMPAHARYWLAPSALTTDLDQAPALDPLCMALELLPRLPESLRSGAQWVVTTGSLPSDLQARIARGDTSVRVFRPGYVLARQR